jgi:hypothetical protein
MNHEKEGPTMPQESPEESSQREQDAMGITCPTCLSAVLGLVFNDQTEKSVIRNLVRVDAGRSASKAYLEAGVREPTVGCGAAIERLAADRVLEVLQDGTLVIYTPAAWKTSRLRADSAEQLAAIRDSAPGGILAPCRPSLDHPAAARGQVESPRPSAHVECDDDGPVILKFDPGIARRSPSRESLRQLCERRGARSS